MSDIDIAVTVTDTLPGARTVRGGDLTALGSEILDVVGRIRALGRTRPSDTALVDLTGPLRRATTYAELTVRVDALAAALRAAGARRGRPVAVLLDRSPEAVVTMLAVLASGAAYCPVDPDSPPARVASLIEALQADLAVAEESRRDLVPPRVAVLAPSAAGSGTHQHTAPDPDSPAYVLFTSGSTGVPKGVSMPHRGLARLVQWQVGDGEPGLRTVQFTASSFDVTFQEVLSTLVTGGSLVVVPEDVRRDPAALLRVLVDERVERLFLPYVALQLLADAAQRTDLRPGGLRHVVTAGERLVVTPAIRDLFAGLPGCRLDNHYGPTEAHLVTSHTLGSDPGLWPTAPPIGDPVDGVVCHVLDDAMRPVEPGTEGELYVAGAGLAAGYAGAGGLTAERFVADPAAVIAGTRMYRTGDVVRQGLHGYEFVGRADGQLKVRGFRVEPAEVEHALLSHPQVVAASVGMRSLPEGPTVLVAYLQTDGPLSPRTIGDHVRALLPAYLVPARFVAVEALPRTTSGKVDTRALAEAPLHAGVVDVTDGTGVPNDAERPVLPQTSGGTPLDETVRALWIRVLGHDDFEGDDDFFDVGGDSLLATWVVAELGQVLGRDLDLSVFLEYSTLDDLVEALRQDGPVALRPSGPSQILTLRPGPSGRSVYLVHPLGGELLAYRELARACRAPVRMLGLGWGGSAPGPGTGLADLAAVHVAQIRTVQPEGPYLLAGWSFGGVLAYEIARQLIAAGGRVDLLALVDANPVVDPITGLPMADTPFLALLDQVAGALDAADATGQDALAELTTSDTWVQLMGAPVPPGTPSAHLRGALDVARVCMRAAMDYVPEPNPAPVVAFQAGGSPADRRQASADALRSLVPGRLDIVTVPGDHWGVLRGAHVLELAASLDTALEQAGAEGSTSHGS